MEFCIKTDSMERENKAPALRKTNTTLKMSYPSKKKFCFNYRLSLSLSVYLKILKSILESQTLISGAIGPGEKSQLGLDFIILCFI